MGRYDFLFETYRTERLKTLGVWSQVPDERMDWRPEPRARTPHEHMVHQCVSEDGWMRTMLDIVVTLPTLPQTEDRRAFLEHYAAVSAERLAVLESRPESWYEGEVRFFDVPRSRAWVLTRRITHTSHHRGQLTAYIRMWGQALYSTYGPTADTGGLPASGSVVIYRASSVEQLLAIEAEGAIPATLPGPGAKAPTERPDGPAAPTSQRP
ncbi:MAG TPA: DinB family protein [Gemmatimonadaceae bacterium]|jgi:Uncharacterized protein conserved in bacteria